MRPDPGAHATVGFVVVATPASGEESIKIAQRLRPDLVLMDEAALILRITMTVSRETGIHAPDRLSAFIAAGAWAAIFSGAALVMSFLLEWLVVPYEELGVVGADLTASYLAASSLRLISTVLFLWALLALYNQQSIAAGAFGLWVSPWPSSAQLSSPGGMRIHCLGECPFHYPLCGD
ncbi:MAG TPA: hypothetical protein VIQ76_19675 [Propionibacteriaceae bacterium]